MVSDVFEPEKDFGLLCETNVEKQQIITSFVDLSDLI